LDVETVVPLGLVINELVTNSLKYAFPDGKDGIIDIELAEFDQLLILIVRDNGIGVSDPDYILEGDSFGYSLINAFANKLDAEVTIRNNGGTEIKLSIKDYKLILP